VKLKFTNMVSLLGIVKLNSDIHSHYHTSVFPGDHSESYRSSTHGVMQLVMMAMTEIKSPMKESDIMLIRNSQ